ncbi:MAG TPA: hypothetical protein VIJ52_07575 [Pseudolabrys sp.]
MKKPHVRISDLMAPTVEPVTPASPELPLAAKSSPPSQPRAAKSHTTIYLSKRVLSELRRIALDFDRKPHDLLIEGVDYVLKKYGRPSVAELSKE